VAVSTTPISSTAPKLKYNALDEYQRQLATQNASSGAGPAMGYFQSAVSGKPSSALSAALSSNREAIARAAGNLRAQTAQTLATGGALGQGQAVRGTQETERSIMQTMADNRSKELQALGNEQATAAQALLSQSNNDRAAMREDLRLAASSDSAAIKASSYAGLRKYLDSVGIQQGTEESAAALDAWAAKEAENDPLYQAERFKAQKTLNTEKINSIKSGNGSFGSKVQDIYKLGEGSAAGQMFTDNIAKARQEDGNFFQNEILPRLARGEDVSAMVDTYITARNKGIPYYVAANSVVPSSFDALKEFRKGGF